LPDSTFVFECKYELDSLAAFLQLSADYYSGTGDNAFFMRPTSSWPDAVETVLDTAESLQGGTYGYDGKPISPQPYAFERHTSSASETLMNAGAGSPVRGNTGMIRSAFRPSDDACIYQLFVPANMMFSRYLSACVPIMEKVNRRLARRMSDMAERIRVGIEKYGRVNHRLFGKIYAYEVDGYGSHNVMVSRPHISSYMGIHIILTYA
jgi:meiotically up-regulated gene 157 (Mug157) protein